MTSQIILINQSGVAVASDTMTTYSGSHGVHKTFPTANKIYELGGNHKVAVMHSGSTAIGGLRYELLIREWALQQVDPLPSLEDYPRVFEDWLANYRILPIDEADVVYRNLCEEFGDFIGNMPEELKQQLAEQCDNGDGISKELEEEVVGGIDEVGDLWFVDDQPFRDLNAKRVLDFLRAQPESAVDHFLEHIALLSNRKKVAWIPSEPLSNAIENFAVKRFLHLCFSRNNAATLNFVGFGTGEPIAGVVEVEVDGFYLGRLRSRRSKREPESGSANEWIGTIAQDEAMQDFIGGLAFGRQKDFVDWAAVSASKALGIESDAEGMASFREDFSEGIRHRLWIDYVAPFRQTMRALSLPNLVQLAESLVRIQSLRSVTAPGEATVGGRVESLTISRQHGVQWHLTYSERESAVDTQIHPLA